VITGASSGIGRELARQAARHGCDVLLTARRAFAMIRLDVTALVQLTGRVLPGMLERGQGRILNVASIAGYLPGPNQAVYNAANAFVKSFTQALAEETRGTGVQVTTLCPGPVDTEFAAVAGTPPTTGSLLMPVRTAAEVAAAGWAGMMAGQAVVVPDLPTRIGVQVMRFAPWRLVVRYAEKSRPRGAEPRPDRRPRGGAGPAGSALP
jgi:short-subunit dehydrogenase